MQQWRHRLGLKLWYHKQFSINSYEKPKYTMQQQHYRLGLELQYYKQFGIKANEKPKYTMQQRITDWGWSFSSTRNSASTLRKKPKYTMQQRHYRLGLKLQYDKQFGSSTKTTSNSALQQKPRQLASFPIEIQRIKCKEEKANHNSVHEGRTSSRYTALHIHGLFLLHNRLIEKRKKKGLKGKIASSWSE
jgi:hypothetical protein